jgi:hypothetical protein
MKPNRPTYLIRLAAAAAVTIVLAGCTHTMKSSEISILKTGSPLKGIRPRTFAFKEFRDVRGTDPYLMYFPGGHKYRLDQPAASLVAMVIRKELERNGHKCIAYSAQSNPDFIIEGSVYRCCYCVAGVKLTVNLVSPEKGVIIKTYKKAYEGEGCGDSFQECVDKPLLAMVKEMSTDPDLAEFLEK